MNETSIVDAGGNPRHRLEWVGAGPHPLHLPAEPGPRARGALAPLFGRFGGNVGHEALDAQPGPWVSSASRRPALHEFGQLPVLLGKIDHQRHELVAALAAAAGES